MSILKHAVRCAIAAAAASGVVNSASALDISNYDSTVVNLKVSGSTALDNTIVNTAIETAAPGGVCNVSGTAGSGGTNTVDIYYIGTTASYTNRLIFCNASADAGVPAGTKLAIYKESAAGSANGVQPLINAAKGQPSTVNFINPTAISDATCATVSNVAASGNFGAYTQHSGCAATAIVTNDIPTGGVADVEGAILLTPGGGPISASDTSTYLKSSGTVDQIWAVTLTKAAYQALQAAEGLAVNDLPANAATLTRSEIAGLITGDVFGWSQIGLAPPDDSVYICRRDKGSGTEASFEAYWAGQRCSLSSLSVPQEDTVTVFANASGGAVRTCLQHVNNGGTQTGFYSSGSKTFVAGQSYAIGFLNGELTPANLTAAGDAYRPVAVDGVGPTIENVTNGFYPYFSTGAGYQIKSGANVPTGNALLGITKLFSLLGNPAFIADSNKAYSSAPWTIANGQQIGDGSPAGHTPAPAVPATFATVATNPVNAYTKQSSGGVDNCDTPVFDALDYATTPVPAKLLGTGNVNN